MKRIVLFLLTNLAVMLVLSVVTSLLGVNKFLTANGLNLGMLLAFSAVIGFGGAFISLLMSKTMAKWSTGARVIEAPSSSIEVEPSRTRRRPSSASVSNPWRSASCRISRTVDRRATSSSRSLFMRNSSMIASRPR